MTAKYLSKPFKELFIVLALLAILISAVASKPVVRKGGGGHAGGGRGGRGGRGGERGSGHSPLPYYHGHSTPHHISSSTRLNPYYYNFYYPILLLRGACSLLCDHISFTRSYINGFALAMVMLLVFLFHFWDNEDEHSDTSTGPSYASTVIMVQFALSGKASSLKQALNRISKTSDKSNVHGFHHLLTETISVLREHHDYWNSGCSYVDKQIRVEGSEKCLKQLLLEDWKRVDKESPVNFKYNKLEENSAVVKILLVAQGVHELPSIITPESLNEVLQSLSSISLDEVVAVEVTWTLQDKDGDMISEEKEPVW